jgi:hypothetical protein
MNAPYEITAVEHLGGYCLRLTVAAGFSGVVDPPDRFATPRGPMFEPLGDVAYFAKVAVDPDLGTVVWPNGVDLAPDVLHQEALSLA